MAAAQQQAIEQQQARERAARRALSQSRQPELPQREPTTKVESPPPAVEQVTLERSADTLPPLPSSVALPDRDDTAIATILPLEEGEKLDIEFVGFDDSVFANGVKVQWAGDESRKPVTVAGLRLTESGVQFRWLPNPPEAAEVAVRNSIVRVRKGGESRAAPLRIPEVVDPLTIDLTSGIVRVPGRCRYQPPADRVFFSLSNADLLPPFIADGVDLERIGLDEEALLRFQFQGDAASRIRLDRQGLAVVAEMEFRYVLPSGDTEGMSITGGNKKRRELGELLDRAAAAQSALPGLQNEFRRTTTELQNVLATRIGEPINGAWVEHPARVAARETAAARLRDKLAALDADIALAEDLIEGRPSFAADMQELEAVAALARQLQGLSGLNFRFFVEVDGEPVTLITSLAPE